MGSSSTAAAAWYYGDTKISRTKINILLVSQKFCTCMNFHYNLTQVGGWKHWPKNISKCFQWPLVLNEWRVMNLLPIFPASNVEESKFQRICPSSCAKILWGITALQLCAGPTSWQFYDLGTVSIRRLSFPGMGIPMLKIRRSQHCLIFNMGIPILVRWHLYIETAPRVPFQYQYLSARLQYLQCISNGNTAVLHHHWCR